MAQNLIDEALSQQTPATQPNLIDAALSQDKPAQSSVPNLIDAALAPTAKTPNLIDAALAPRSRPKSPSGLPSPQPQQTPSLIPPDTTITARKPSVWERISNIFTAGIPQFSSYTASNPKYGAMQLVTPEAALTPQEQQRHPIITGAGEVAGSLTSPQNVATLAASGGLGSLPGAAGKLATRLVSGGFSAQMIYGAYKQLPEVKAAFDAGNYSEAERLLTHVALSGGLAALGLKHAATGKASVGNVGETNLADTVPVEPDSPIAKAVSDTKPVPEVRLTDSTAAKEHVQNQETIVPPTPATTGTKLYHGTTDLSLDSIRKQGLTQGMLTDSASEAQEHAERRVNQLGQGKPAVITANVLPEHIGEPIPIETASGKKLGNYYRLESPIPPERLDVPKARIVSDSYTPVVSRDEALAEAITRMIHNSGELQKLGLDPEKIEHPSDVQKMLDGAAAHIEQNLDPRVGSTITFPAQRALAEQLGYSLEELLARKSGQTANAETAIAARSFLAASQERVMNLARNAATGDTDYLKQFTDALAQHQEIVKQVAGIKAEAGRALGSLRIPVSDLPKFNVTDLLSKLPAESATKAAQLLSNLDPNDPRDARAMNQIIAELTPSDTPSRMWELYRNYLLSSPSSLIKKVSSDSMMLVTEGLAKLVKSGIDPEAKAGEALWFMRGAANAIRRIPDIISGKLDISDMPGFESHEDTHAFKGLPGRILRAPSSALSFATNIAYLANLKGELYARAFRQAVNEGLTGADREARIEYLAEHPTDETMDAADKLALKNTFQNQLGKGGRGLQQFVQNVPGLRYLAPFVKTPLNIMKASAELSPLGLLRGAYKGDPDMIARGIIGTVLLSGIGYEALQNRFSGGGPVDYRKEETLEERGWQPYSFRVGGHWVSLHKLEPFGIAAGTTADLIHGIHAGDPETISETKGQIALAHLMRNYRDVPFMMTAANFLDSLEGNQGGDKILRFIDKQIGSIVPALVANIAEAHDPTLRHPENLAQTLESRIPGLTQNVPAIIGVSGKPVQRPASAAGGMNPFVVSTETRDPVLTELTRLGVATPQPPSSVKMNQSKDAAVPLTYQERSQIAQHENAKFYAALSKTISTPAWQRKSDPAKLDEITRLRKASAEDRRATVKSIWQDQLAQMSVEQAVDYYTSSPPAKQKVLRTEFFNRVIDWRNRARAGQVPDDERARINRKLSALKQTA